MSSTRYADGDSELHQQRWASDPDYSTSISALLAAKRISLIADDELRNLLWFIQWRSLKPRGLRLLAEELIATFPERLGTAGMRRSRLKPGKKLSRRETVELRKEFPDGILTFALRGEPSGSAPEPGLISPDESDHAPEFYRSDDFIKKIAVYAENSLHEQLMRLCVDPGITLNHVNPRHYEADASRSAGIWYFDDLLGALKQFRSERCRSSRIALAETQASRQINEALDFSFSERRMVLIEGESGTGKSETIKAWCDRKQGLVRYVEVPSSNDDRSFFAAIAESLGVARGTSYNVQQIKLRVEEALHVCDLMVVFDEGQRLWPGYARPQGIPPRIEWIMTARGAGTTIAIAALPKFSEWRKRYAERTLWDDRQMQRRLNRTVRLPDVHSDEELGGIIRAHFAEADPRSWKLLKAYGIVNKREKKQGASAIVEAIHSARYRAKLAGRKAPIFADIEAALQNDHGFINPQPLRREEAALVQASPPTDGQFTAPDRTVSAANDSVSIAGRGRFRGPLLSSVPG